MLESCYIAISNKGEGRIVASYLPMRGEIDVAPLTKHFSINRYRICLPVVKSPTEPLVFREWMPGEELESGAHGVKVPTADKAEITPDIIILPLIAYDTMGYRLGYGGGYYDRTLKALRQKQHTFIAVGAAFTTQQIKTLPREPQDERLDAVITEKGMVWF